MNKSVWVLLNISILMLAIAAVVFSVTFMEYSKNGRYQLFQGRIGAVNGDGMGFIFKIDTRTGNASIYKSATHEFDLISDKASIDLSKLDFSELANEVKNANSK